MNKNDIENNMAFSIIESKDTIYKNIKEGMPINITSLESNNQEKIKIESMFEMFNKITTIESFIQHPYALVINPETFEEIKPKMLNIKVPTNSVPIHKIYNGITMRTSSKVPKNIIKVAWNHEQLMKILRGEDNEMGC